jgi:tRNA(fMet)-specific endonuclease VapC
MIRYMLDTNIVSCLLREQPAVTKRVVAKQMSDLCISVITEAELLFGLAKRPEAKKLHLAVSELLKRVEVLPWDSEAAECYGNVRATLERSGTTIAPLDLLIGCHAQSLKLVLVTNDQVFAFMPELEIEDWSA